MTFDEYSRTANSTSLAPGPQDMTSTVFLAKILGLTGESGEIADKVKKILRDQSGVPTTDDKREIIKELGDVLWYINAICDHMDVPLQQVADMNLQKVLSRKARGVTHGSGDNR